MSASGRDEIFEFYRLNRTCCAWEERNMIEEIKRLLRIIYREARANFRDNRSFNYLKNVDINKLIKKHSKYRPKPVVQPIEVAY